MRSYEFDASQIDEAPAFLDQNGTAAKNIKAGVAAGGRAAATGGRIAVKSIANWFAPKYKAFMDKNEAARQAGEAEIKKFTNDHMNTFNTHMGRYQQNWQTVTMYVIYKYLQRTMGLSDNEIIQVINNVMKQSNMKTTTLQALKDPNGNIRVALKPQIAQITAEKIIASAALAQLEKHWDKQAGINTEEPAEQPNANLKQEEPVTNMSSDEDLIKTPIVKKASDGFEYRWDVSPVNSAWIRTDGSGEAKGRIARELNKNISNNRETNLSKNLIQKNVASRQSRKINQTDNTINNARSINSLRTPQNTKRQRDIREYNEFDGDIYDILETATGGATASGSVASVANPMGNTISRTPNLFGYIPQETQTILKKRKKQRKSAP